MNRKIRFYFVLSGIFLVSLYVIGAKRPFNAFQNELSFGFLFLFIFMLIFYLWSQLKYFIKVLARAMDNIYQGRYKNGFIQSGESDFKTTADSFNNMVSRLIEYDEIRADEVSHIKKVLDHILTDTRDFVSVISVDEAIMYFSKSLQELFNIQQDKLPLSSVLKIPENKIFSDAYRRLVEKFGVSLEISTKFTCPIGRNTNFLHVRMYSVKRRDQVKSVVVFFSKLEE